MGGGSGLYNVYFTTPSSTNVNAAGSLFDITSDLPTVTLNPVNLNDTNTGPDEIAGVPFTGGANNRWLKIATVSLPRELHVHSHDHVECRFVRVVTSPHGVMWELVVPEPTTLGLTAIGLGGLRSGSSSPLQPELKKSDAMADRLRVSIVCGASELTIVIPRRRRTFFWSTGRAGICNAQVELVGLDVQERRWHRFRRADERRVGFAAGNARAISALRAVRDVPE